MGERCACGVRQTREAGLRSNCPRKMTNDERNPNVEIRQPKENRNPKSEYRCPVSDFGIPSGLSGFGFRISLSFVICHSSFKNMPRILIIEDELPMRTALQDVLQAEGYRVLTAADGQSGLQRAREEKPDLVLLDI